MPVYSSSSSSSRNRQDEKLDGMKGRRRTKKTKWSNNTTNTGRNTHTYSVADNDIMILSQQYLRIYGHTMDPHKMKQKIWIKQVGRNDRNGTNTTNSSNNIKVGKWVVVARNMTMIWTTPRRHHRRRRRMKEEEDNDEEYRQSEMNGCHYTTTNSTPSIEPSSFYNGSMR